MRAQHWFRILGSDQIPGTQVNQPAPELRRRCANAPNGEDTTNACGFAQGSNR